MFSGPAGCPRVGCQGSHPPPPEGGNLLPPSAGELIEAEKKWQSIPYTGRGGKASQGDAHSTCTAEANAPDEHLV